METFKGLCDGKYYEIPANQRGYSWGKEHIEAVFNDLQIAGAQSHYMGPIIVSRDEYESDFQSDDRKTMAKFILEDGQQRFTTYLLILNGIKNRLIELGDTSIVKDLDDVIFFKRKGVKLRLQNLNNDLNECLLHTFTGSPKPDRLTPPMSALLKASEHIHGLLTDYKDTELMDWANIIFNQAKFLWVNLSSEGVNRYLAFDAINSRGLPLSEFDKVKNFCVLLGEERELGIVSEDEWFEAITHLEHFNVGSRSSEETFISELYSVFHGESVTKAEVHDAFVKKYGGLIKAKDNELQGKVVEFVNTWEAWAKSFGFLSSPNRSSYYGVMSSPGAGVWLDKLDNLELPTICRPLLIACHMSMNEQDFEKVVKACEVYTFRMYAVQGFRKDKNAKLLLDLAREVLILKKDINHVLTKICVWLSSDAPMARVIATLNDGNPKYANDEEVRGWYYTYYFLYEYELWVSPKGVEPLVWASSRELKINTQEHILPQSHRDGEFWEEHWPDEQRADKYKHRLGNLVLVPKDGNSSLGRKPISKKIDDPSAHHSYSHKNATNSEKRIINFTDGKTWKEGNIMDREYELLKFAAERWSLSCCSDNAVISIKDETSDHEPDKIIIDDKRCIDSVEP